jgi:hypothetical protein
MFWRNKKENRDNLAYRGLRIFSMESYLQFGYLPLKGLLKMISKKE